MPGESISPLLVGITGGIGVGKSLISKIFRILGVPVYDSDSRARAIMYFPEIMEQVVRLFGKEAYENGMLNRQMLAKRAFADPDILAQLNAIVHPAVAMDFRDWVAAGQSNPYLLKEAALLFETGGASALDKVITVTAPDEIRIDRVLRRDPQRTRQQVLDIMSQQWPESRKISNAHFLITNDDLTPVIPQVLQIHQTLSQLKTSFPGA